MSETQKEKPDALTIGGFLELLSAADPRAQGFRPAFAFDPEQTLLRKTAARILHFYLRDILAVPDIPDITPAAVLKDLYDCRVCVNSIAQIYLRGIMEPREYPGGLLLFDGSASVDEVLAGHIISRTLQP